MVKWFCRTIGAGVWIGEPVQDSDLLARSSEHKSIRHLKIVGRLLHRAFTEQDRMDYRFDQADHAYARQQLPFPYLAFVPGSGHREKFKRWPAARYVALGRRILNRRPDLGIVIVGGPGEEPLIAEISSQLRSARVIGLGNRLALREVAGVLQQAKFAVGADCGGMHLAKACGCKVCCLFGPTNSSITAPIDAEMIIDLKFEGRPWYSRRALSERRDSDRIDSSMYIDDGDVYLELVKAGWI
jgi:ADP-heptose:LPS heptosyltransferase